VHGVTYDGQNIWFAAGNTLNALDPASGKMLRSIDVAAHAGTAFDGQHLFQLAEDRIQKIDPKTGRVIATIPSPGGGGDSGLTWAEGTLWVGHYRDRKIHQIDPETGAILRTIESNRFVTGVTWVDGELWHATWEGDESELRRVDPRTGEVLERIELPPGSQCFGAGVRWRRSVLLRRRKERQGESRPPTQARLVPTAARPPSPASSAAAACRGADRINMMRKPTANTFPSSQPASHTVRNVALM
jgi:PQQ-like domain